MQQDINESRKKSHHQLKSYPANQFTQAKTVIIDRRRQAQGTYNIQRSFKSTKRIAGKGNG